MKVKTCTTEEDLPALYPLMVFEPEVEEEEVETGLLDQYGQPIIKVVGVERGPIGFLSF